MTDLTHHLWAAATSPATATHHVATLVTYPPAQVATAAGQALERGVTDAWQRGWLPYDLVQTVSRSLTDVEVSLVVSAVAAENQTYAPATIHPRWQHQLTETGVSVWWDPSRPWLTQWADRDSHTQVETLAHTIVLLAHLLRLTRLPLILPLPGTARASAVSNMGVDHKVLARVRALLAKAESTPYPHEAESLTAKAQELMNRHAFSRALLDVTPQSATSQRLWLDNPYLSAKYQLVNVIADANRSRAVFYRDLGLVAMVGEELDLDIIELLTTSLLVQATRAMAAQKSRTRSFRHAFLMAYAERIGERLRSGPPADDRLLPVLARRKAAVEELFGSMFAGARTKSVSVSNAAGWGAGRAAADHANLTVDRATLKA
jgi:hypothetical protein